MRSRSRGRSVVCATLFRAAAMVSLVVLFVVLVALFVVLFVVQAAPVASTHAKTLLLLSLQGTVPVCCCDDATTAAGAVDITIAWAGVRARHMQNAVLALQAWQRLDEDAMLNADAAVTVPRVKWLGLRKN